MLARGDRMFLVALRVLHALKMALLVTGVAMGSAAIWYVVNAPDGSKTEPLLADLKAGPVFVSSLINDDWKFICLVAEEDNPNALLANEGAAHTKGCEGWNGSMKYFPGFGSIAISGKNSCQIMPVNIERLVPAPKGESACYKRFGLNSLVKTGAVPPYGLEFRRN